MLVVLILGESTAAALFANKASSRVETHLSGQRDSCSSRKTRRRRKTTVESFQSASRLKHCGQCTPLRAAICAEVPYTLDCFPGTSGARGRTCRRELQEGRTSSWSGLALQVEPEFPGTVVKGKESAFYRALALSSFHSAQLTARRVDGLQPDPVQPVELVVVLFRQAWHFANSSRCLLVLLLCFSVHNSTSITRSSPLVFQLKEFPAPDQNDDRDHGGARTSNFRLICGHLPRAWLI
ncbi:hypothetical protein EXIGLDRAFT_108053 [Exidia glandulosa HHB12029]|uniref:Uncharacterized protein n=1 Tax=Exidia glandulosa HHB12029 TaxID=1314781 RepID=A0A165GRJ5_EXIGL|nr:hypothetical protein EXIGLDRAFT_108053 [Exidia glandulosa HHB12029]